MYGLYHAVARRKGVQSTACYTCCLNHMCVRERDIKKAVWCILECVYFSVSKAMIIMAVLVVFL